LTEESFVINVRQAVLSLSQQVHRPTVLNFARILACEKTKTNLLFMRKSIFSIILNVK